MKEYQDSETILTTQRASFLQDTTNFFQKVHVNNLPQNTMNAYVREGNIGENILVGSEQEFNMLKVTVNGGKLLVYHPSYGVGLGLCIDQYSKRTNYKERRSTMDYKEFKPLV